MHYFMECYAFYLFTVIHVFFLFFFMYLVTYWLVHETFPSNYFLFLIPGRKVWLGLWLMCQTLPCLLYCTPSLCAHMLWGNTAEFPLQLFSFISYQNELEIVAKTRLLPRWNPAVNVPVISYSCCFANLNHDFVMLSDKCQLACVRNNSAVMLLYIYL